VSLIHRGSSCLSTDRYESIIPRYKHIPAISALKEILWGDISEGNDIILIIPMAVTEELDRFKHEGNSRRAKRARTAATFFKDILSCKNSNLIVKESNPRVEITFAPSLHANEKAHTILDLARADDRIINEALSFSNNNPDCDTFLLTNDFGPRLKAQRCELNCIPVPDEWLLPPEPDERDKNIHELTQKINSLEKIFPGIIVSAFHN
jgi:hypothetical protein